MQRKLILASVMTAIGISGASLALAAGNNAGNSTAMTEAQMFQAAKVKLDEAGKIALREVQGTLAAIGFNDENGKGVYEAMVIGADGQPSIVKIDADTGAVLGKWLAANFDDEDGDHENGGDDGDHDGEQSESEEG